MIMTGFSRLSYMKQPIDEEAIRAGANDFISKPFSPSEFSARFQKMMATQEVLSQMKARQQEIERRSSEMIAAIQKESMDRIETIKKGFTEGGGTEAPPREGNGLPEGPLKPRAAAVSSEPVKPPCPIREKSEQETFKLGEYTRSVQKRIASYWTQPATWRPEWSTLEAEITVIIRRDGKIQEIRFDKRSINSNYDDLCMATLRKAEPFPPFPPELRDESIEIEITFQKAR